LWHGHDTDWHAKLPGQRHIGCGAALQFTLSNAPGNSFAVMLLGRGQVQNSLASFGAPTAGLLVL
jgi:hypothetical protein